MKKSGLRKNPYTFQGEKYIEKNNNYFEGWYFKNTNNKNSISFIPGISIEDGNKSAFIQVITNEFSEFIPYSFEDFKFNHNPFYISIGKNFFSQDKMSINIDNENIKAHGGLNFSNGLEIEKTLFAPNIMGPFSYVPFMECNHAILNMKNTINGQLSINSTSYLFENNIGYIEKDWGSSFPKSYIWAQGNCFKDSNSSFFLSVADIPFKSFNFVGFICVLIFNGKEYRFTTYNGAKFQYIDNKKILLKNNNYTLRIVLEENSSSELIAPTQKGMKKLIKESINSKIYLKLYNNNSLIFDDFSSNCGIEFVKS